MNPYRPSNRPAGRDKAATYLRALSNGLVSEEMIETYVGAGPEMVTFLEERTPIEWRCVPDFPDYHRNRSALHRLAGARPYPSGEHGEWKDRIVT